MKVCFATSECVPFVKTGGLADVSGALPKALSELGCDVRLFLPLYQSVRVYDHGFTPATDLQDVPVRLGGGPALVHRDSAAHYSPRILRELRRLGAERGIPVQDAVLYHYGSDGANLVRQGMETALVAPPIRYSHSPFEAIDPADVVATVDLLVAYLTAHSAEQDRDGR